MLRALKEYELGSPEVRSMFYLIALSSTREQRQLTDCTAIATRERGFAEVAL